MAEYLETAPDRGPCRVLSKQRIRQNSANCRLPTSQSSFLHSRNGFFDTEFSNESDTKSKIKQIDNYYGVEQPASKQKKKLTSSKTMSSFKDETLALLRDKVNEVVSNKLRTARSIKKDERNRLATKMVLATNTKLDNASLSAFIDTYGDYF